MHLNNMCLLIPAAFICNLQLSEAFANYNIDCCTEYRDHISKHFLKRVETHKIQRADGICDLRAMVLYTKHKAICVNPENKNVLQWIKRKNKKRCKSSICGKRKKKNRPRKKRPKNTRRTRT